MKRLAIVGMGPGGLDYLTQAAERAIDGADILIGAPRFLSLFPGKPGLALPRGVDETLRLLETEGELRRVALLVSGDPGLYSLLAAVRARFGRDAYEVVPGVSSFQLAFAKAGLGWEGAAIASVHGRGLEALSSISPDRPGVVFLDASNDASRVAAALAERLGPDRRCLVARDLGGDSEALVEGSLADIAATDVGGLCVMILP